MAKKISKKTLKTMDKSMKNLKKGKVSKPINLKKAYPVIDIPIEEVYKTADVINKYNLAVCNIAIDFIEIKTGRKIKFDLKQTLDYFYKLSAKEKKNER